MALNQVKKKAFTFTEDDVAEEKRFELGVHHVQITAARLDETEDGRVYIDVDVIGLDDETATVRLWLHTEGARKVSLGTIRRILVHNQTEEEKKQAVRDTFAGLAGRDLLYFEGILKRLDGCEAWLKLEHDAERTYTDKHGNVKQSINRNLYGYEPQLTAETAETTAEPETAVTASDDWQPVDASDVPF